MTNIPEDLIDLVEELVIYDNNEQKEELIENFLELEYYDPMYEEPKKEKKNTIIYIDL